MTVRTLSDTALVGVFHDRDDARRAIDELLAAGFAEHEIGLVSQNVQGDAIVADLETDTKAAEGAAAGVAAGAGVGALWAIGIAAGFLPAIGPAIAGGLLASLVASAAGGAVVGGLVGALVGLGIPEDEALYYESEVLAGRTLLTVNAGSRAALVAEIIDRHHGQVRSTTTSGEAPLAAQYDPAHVLPEAGGYEDPGTDTPHATSDLNHAELRRVRDQDASSEQDESIDPRRPR